MKEFPNWCIFRIRFNCNKFTVAYCKNDAKISSRWLLAQLNKAGTISAKVPCQSQIQHYAQPT